MRPSFALWASLSLALSTAWAGESWKDITCPAPSTVSLSFTSYYPVTTTTTASYTTTPPPITIYQTIISTTTLTTTNIVTTTSTTVSPSPTTITATQYLTETSTTVSISPTTTTAFVTETTTSVSISVTTATTTTTATEYFTETSTTVSISISPTTATVTQTLTETSTTLTVSPTTNTLTATEIVSEYEITTRATSLTICPTRIANPTYTAIEPYPTDWTWGCPPGWLCKPGRTGCNFEAGIPDREFKCAPNECIPASALQYPLQTWDADIYGNSTPATNPALTYNALDSFFNMNPGDFGLTYAIFVVDEVLTRTTTITLLPSPTVGARQAQTSIPGACYPWCNNCLLEAQSRGKTSALCVPGSAFEVSLEQCEECIEYHRTDNTGSFVQIAPQFQQFLDYCDQFATVVVSTSVTATTTNEGGSVSTLVTTTSSTTVTPTTDVSLSTSGSVTVTVPTTTEATPTTTSSPPPSTSPPETTTTTTTPPPAPSTYTSTVATTTVSETTISGSAAWSQVTMILPVGENSTTTVYGSDLARADPSLVFPLPVAAAVSYTTTGTEDGGATGSASATASDGGGATTSTFPGAASRLGDVVLRRTMAVALVATTIIMLLL